MKELDIRIRECIYKKIKKLVNIEIELYVQKWKNFKTWSGIKFHLLVDKIINRLDYVKWMRYVDTNSFAFSNSVNFNFALFAMGQW